MSRYTITVSGHGRSDPEAIIGYDPPLQTFFLHAFPHEVTDDPGLWIGAYDHEFKTLDALHRATLTEGYDFLPLPAGVAERLTVDKARDDGHSPHDGTLGEFLRRLRSE
jgi:hypothetical protein